MIQDPITAEIIHTMGALFVDDTDLYTWRENTLDPWSICNRDILFRGYRKTI